MPIRKTPLDDAGRKAYTERAQRKARTATTVDELLNDDEYETLLRVFEETNL